MPEINLLPDDLRDKERKELNSARKTPKVVNVQMSSPQRDVAKQPLRGAKPSLVARMFSRKTKKAAPLPVDPEQVPEKLETPDIKRTEKRVFNIPKIKISKASSGGNFTSTPNVSGPNNTSSDAKDIKGSSGDSPYDQYAAQDSKAKFIAEMKREGQSSVIPEKQVKSKKIKKKSFSLFGGLSKKKKSLTNNNSILEQAIKDDAFKEGGDTAQKDESKGKEVDKSKQEEVAEVTAKGKSVLELNLIPEELNKYPELEFPRRILMSGLSIFIFILLIIGAYLGITWYQINITKQIKAQEQLIIETDAAIASEESKQIQSTDLQKRLVAIEELLNNHIYWTEFFKLLEENTLPGVSYSGFAMSGKESIVLAATAKDYKTIAEQIIVFQDAKHFVKSVNVSSAAAQLSLESGFITETTFNIDLKFQPGIFLKNN